MTDLNNKKEHSFLTIQKICDSEHSPVSFRMICLLQPALDRLWSLSNSFLDIQFEARKMLETARYLRDNNGSVLRKKKALSDAMKLLKSHGLSYHQATIQSSRPNSVPGYFGFSFLRLLYLNVFVSDSSSLSDILAMGSLSQYENEFLALVELVQCLRYAAVRPHSDLTSVESQRCLGLVVG